MGSTNEIFDALYRRKAAVFRIILLVVLGLLALNCPSSLAHYPWITLENDPGKRGIMNFYFEDKPRPGIGEYLQPFVDRAQTWVRTLQMKSPERIQLVEVTRQGNRWLSGEISKFGPRSIESYTKWGVYRFPKAEIETLLHFYAKHLDINSLEALRALGKANDFRLDIVPDRYVKPSMFFNLVLGVERFSNFINRWTGPSVEFLVRWKGQPAAETSFVVRGPTGPKIRLRTDTKGYVRFQAPSSGLYTFMTSVKENDIKGVDHGKKYDEVRHTSTLTLKLPIVFSEDKHQ